jgi:hypothetical protein
MRTITEHRIIEQGASFTLQLHAGADILSIETAGGGPVLATMANPAAPLQTRTFRTFRGSVSLDESVQAMTFVGTFRTTGDFEVVYVFEV